MTDAIGSMLPCVLRRTFSRIGSRTLTSVSAITHVRRSSHQPIIRQAPTSQPTRSSRRLNTLTDLLQLQQLQQLQQLHTTRSSLARTAHNSEKPPDSPPPTDFAQLDVFADIPKPATGIDACLPRGFELNSGLRLMDGDGVLLVGGETFAWRPWGRAAVPRLLNEKGQWEVEKEAWALFGVLWPRPDLLILGVGPVIRPLSPQNRKAIGALGMRLDVLDTANAAAQFNLLATERGVHDVAAALVPIGWKEGVGAG